MLWIIKEVIFMCKNCVISAIATFFSVYFLIVAVTVPIWSVWIYSLIITVLVFIAVRSCPIINKEGWTCCSTTPKKAVKKKK